MEILGIDLRKYAKAMRMNAVRNEHGIIMVSPQLWEEIASVIDEVANLSEQGRLLQLPCKVGDTIYCIVPRFKGEKQKVYKTRFHYSMMPMFGKYVFLTKEEAEQALKEMEEKECGTEEIHCI